MAFKGRSTDRAVYNDRFDAMHEGELLAESMALWCSRDVTQWGYNDLDTDRYAEWREWAMTVSESELRDWVRVNSSHEVN